MMELDDCVFEKEYIYIHVKSHFVGGHFVHYVYQHVCTRGCRLFKIGCADMQRYIVSISVCTSHIHND